jgi:hypothetical protein
MDREVTASLRDPFFSVILRRMFVRRPLELFEGKAFGLDNERQCPVLLF